MNVTTFRLVDADDANAKSILENMESLIRTSSGKKGNLMKVS